MTGAIGHLYLFPKSRVVLVDSGAQVRRLSLRPLEDGRPDADRQPAAGLGGDRLQSLGRPDAHRARRDARRADGPPAPTSTTRACWPTATTRSSPTSRPTSASRSRRATRSTTAPSFFARRSGGGRAGFDLHGGVGYDNIAGPAAGPGRRRAGGRLLLVDALTVSYDFTHETPRPGSPARSRLHGSPFMQISSSGPAKRSRAPTLSSSRPRSSLATRSSRLIIEAAVGDGDACWRRVAVAAPAPHLGWGVLRPHPVWLVVLALAARYGARGLVLVGAGRLGRAGAAGAVAGGALPAHVLTRAGAPVRAGRAGRRGAGRLGRLGARATRRRIWRSSCELLAAQGQPRCGRAGRAAAGGAGPARAQRSSGPVAHLPARRGAPARRRRSRARPREAALALVVARLGARAGAVQAPATVGGRAMRSPAR